MKICFIDTECRSVVPIQRGNDLYCRSAECTIVTWAIGDAPVQSWDVLDRPLHCPSDLMDALHDERVTLVAHNAGFDRSIIQYSLGIPTASERWFCTKACAYAHGLPGSLEMLGKVLSLSVDQAKLADEGYQLMRWFCIPKPDGTFRSPSDHSDKWRRFNDYAIRDTEALREIYRRLPKHNYCGASLDLYHLDQTINRRGFGFDVRLATAAQSFLKRAKTHTDSSVAHATSGAVGTVTQRQRLLGYLQQTLGSDIENLRAAEIRDYLERDNLTPEVRFLLETRLEAAKSSGAKYAKGLQSVGPQNRIRDSIQFSGAGRTGRFSGRGFQPHNLPRAAITVRKADGDYAQTTVKAAYIDKVIIPGILSGQALDNDLVYGGPNEAAAISLRHAIVAALGNTLVVGDWSNIESRILAWIANQAWKLKAYADGQDLYKLLAANSLGITIEEVTDTLRQSFKVVELACGFGGGVGALVTMAAVYQLDLQTFVEHILPKATAKQLQNAERSWRRAFLSGADFGLEYDQYVACDVLKQQYRESNDKIDQFRHDLNDAIVECIAQPGGNARTVGRCTVWCSGTWLIIALPSGRRLLYASPRIERENVVDPETAAVSTRQFVSYSTARGRSWLRERGWSGLWVENIVQAIAADILRACLLRLQRHTQGVPEVAAYLATLPQDQRTAISLHVHDEVVLDVPVGSYTLAQLLEQMVAANDWSTGLPLAAEGWSHPTYGKRAA